MKGRRPFTLLRYSAVSVEVNRKSVARTSVNWPRTLNRAMGRHGSPRVAMTKCICGDMRSSRKAMALSMGSGINFVVIVKDKNERFRNGGDVMEKGR